MSVSEEDISASAKMTALRPRSRAADMAHHLRSRHVLQVVGDLSSLPEIATGAAPKHGEVGRFVSLLTDAGHLDADMYISASDHGALVDVHASLVDAVADRLSALPGVTDVDRSAAERWRVFGELPDQKAAETPYETIRCLDGRRRELGSRVLRDAAEPEGMDWRHGRKWDGHAMRLGLLPDHRCILGLGVHPHEAGYHRLLDGIGDEQADSLERRVLPVRIDPLGDAVPVMAGAPLMAGEEALGVMLDQEGVCGIALVSVEPWRAAVADGVALSCLGEHILVTWPTWLSPESKGRYGPAGGSI